MTSPTIIDLPHSLGAAEAKRRIQDGIGSLGSHIPGGAADVRSSWQDDVMTLLVKAMGQEVNARIDVQDTIVRLEVALPPMLSFFGKAIEGVVRKQGARMLEDGSKKG